MVLFNTIILGFDARDTHLINYAANLEGEEEGGKENWKRIWKREMSERKRGW